MKKISKGCPFCGNTTVVTVDSKAYQRWQNGALIQVAMPSLSATDREVLISGMCPTCQTKVFGY